MQACGGYDLNTTPIIVRGFNLSIAPIVIRGVNLSITPIVINIESRAVLYLETIIGVVLNKF